MKTQDASLNHYEQVIRIFSTGTRPPDTSYALCRRDMGIC